MKPVDISKFGRPSTLRLVDFSGGQNTTVSPSLLNDNEAVEATNMSLLQKGTITVRKGRRKRYAVNFGTKPVTGLGGYYKRDGTARLVVSTGENLYADEPYLGTKYDTQEDFASGTVGQHVDIATTPGDMKLAVITPPHNETKVTALSSGTFVNAEYAGGVLKLTKMGEDFFRQDTLDLTIEQRVAAQDLSPVLANGSGTNYAIDSGVVSLSKVVS